MIVCLWGFAPPSSGSSERFLIAWLGACRGTTAGRCTFGATKTGLCGPGRGRVGTGSRTKEEEETGLRQRRGRKCPREFHPPSSSWPKESLRSWDWQEQGGRLVTTKKPKPTTEPRERKNTAIYITNLPLDTDVDEVHSVFSKCGVIAEEIDSRKPRIKLYTDDQGNFKGDALILYFRAESVDLAIQMLDDTDFRFGESAPAGKMKVVAADFSYKVQKEAPVNKGAKGDKKKIIRKTQKLNR